MCNSVLHSTGVSPEAHGGRTIGAMTSGSDSLVLSGEFPPATGEQWRALVDGVLKGAPFDRKLVTTLYDAIAVQPLYTAADHDGRGDPAGWPGLAPFVRGPVAAPGGTSGWDIRTEHRGPDAAETNVAVLDDLERGATSLWLRIGAGGLPLGSLDGALDGVYLDLAPVVLDAGDDTVAATAELEALWAARGVAPSDALGCYGADPLGRRARTGRPGDLAAAAALAVTTSSRYPGVRTFVVDATPAHDAGGSDVEELGISLATGVAYLRAMVDAGLGIDDALGQLTFRYAVSADQFTSIAKLRAARRLWARVAEVCGAAPASGAQHQHAVTSAAMMTRRDPWVNLLRTTVATFAAGVGGAESITVRPFDEAIGRSDRFARRIARNTQALLIDETHLARVGDPAGGSWYVESLTDAVAEGAWSWFREIEGAGGMAAALDSGLVADRLATTWAKRSADLATRKAAITGVSEFPDIDEEPVAREPWPAEPEGGLPRVRHAAGFEALRDRADAATPRPTVFLANLGPIATHTARATFAKNLFEAGGIVALGNDGFDSPVAAGAAFAASGARIAVICSNDATYDEHGAATAEALRGAGALRVYLAGKGDIAGVDEQIHLGCDVLAALGGALDTLGVQ